MSLLYLFQINFFTFTLFAKKWNFLKHRCFSWAGIYIRLDYIILKKYTRASEEGKRIKVLENKKYYRDCLLIWGYTEDEEKSRLKLNLKYETERWEKKKIEE